MARYPTYQCVVFTPNYLYTTYRQGISYLGLTRGIKDQHDHELVTRYHETQEYRQSKFI
jgi:hypothetical protein